MGLQAMLVPNGALGSTRELAHYWRFMGMSLLMASEKSEVVQILMKPTIFALCVAVALGCDGAQANSWRPSGGHTQVPIWPEAIPDAHPVEGSEESKTVTDRPVAGRSWVNVEPVSQPTMTVYSPAIKNTGVAVVVFPGGGYQTLAIDLEGTEVCDWLTSKGITCVLLKYRVPGDGRRPHSGAYPDSPMALEDAQRTMGLVRMHAAEWHIDPHKIGVLGFSAGGHLVAAISTHFEKRLYARVDPADDESCRPDFGVALYPGHMLEHTTKKFELNPYVPVTNQTPPTFLVQDEDDPVDDVENSLVYYVALKKAGVPVEMHLYAHGGHAFGLRRTTFPVTAWPQLMETWLATIGMIPG
jgi:acetyl esterase/lipase